MTEKRRWALIAVAVAAIVVVLSLSLGRSGLEVETAIVHRDTLHEVVREEGRTRVRDRFAVATPITGRLARIEVTAGEKVTAGQVLARISSVPDDPRSLSVSRAGLAAAEGRRAEAAARVEEARGAADQASREAARRRELEQAGALSREALEQAELAAASARRHLEAARGALAAAGAAVEASRAGLAGANPAGSGGPAVEVHAPTAGRVLRVLEESERVVQAGTPLVEIGDAGGLEVVVDVLSEDAVRIQPGDLVVIDEWGGDRPLHGRVRVVEPDAFTETSALGVEEQRVNVVVDLEDMAVRLGSGYRIVADIVTWSGRVLSVPTSALLQQEDGWRVFAVEDGEATLRVVVLGHRGMEAAEVVEGLEEGDEVILFPSDAIDEGVAVSPVRKGSGS